MSLISQMAIGEKTDMDPCLRRGDVQQWDQTSVLMNALTESAISGRSSASAMFA